MQGPAPLLPQAAGTDGAGRATNKRARRGEEGGAVRPWPSSAGAAPGAAAALPPCGAASGRAGAAAALVFVSGPGGLRAAAAAATAAPPSAGAGAPRQRGCPPGLGPTAQAPRWRRPPLRMRVARWGSRRGGAAPRRRGASASWAGERWGEAPSRRGGPGPLRRRARRQRWAGPRSCHSPRRRRHCEGSGPGPSFLPRPTCGGGCLPGPWPGPRWPVSLPSPASCRAEGPFDTSWALSPSQ